MNRIRPYLNAISERIAVDYKLAGLSSHKPDIGANRERIVEAFLQKHIPERLTASLGGYVIGATGEESKQIDVLVSSDISIRFNESEKTFITVESLASAISVKSDLDKPALEDCLINIASIPQVDARVLSFLGLLPNSYEKFSLMHPSLYVFAYEGVSVETCLAHITNFYKIHLDIPKNRYACGVIVNGKYLIRYCKAQSSMMDGTIVPSNTFVGQPLSSNDTGYPFTFYLNDLSSYVSWLPYMNIDLTHYFNNSYSSAPTTSIAP